MATKEKNKITAIAKKTEPAITEKPSMEKVRNAIKTAIPADYDTEALLDDLGQNVLPRMKKAAQGMTSSQSEDGKKLWDAMFAFGTDTHIPLAESVGKTYRAMVMRDVREIEKEYDCKTPTEKMLAETIAGAHARIMQYSRRLNRFASVDSISDLDIPYHALWSKEVDRAHRQMMTAITTLKQIKSPQLNVSINAKTAFVAENQQINSTPPKS
jgi:hypothetical protein